MIQVHPAIISRTIFRHSPQTIHGEELRNALNLAPRTPLQLPRQSKKEERLGRRPGVHLLEPAAYSGNQVPVRRHERVLGELDDIYQQDDKARQVAACVEPV